MRKISFSSVAEPCFDDMSSLFMSAQQMAFAMLVTDINVAKTAVEFWPEKEDVPTPEDILRWAEIIRNSADKSEFVKSLIKPCSPYMNTHHGFFTEPLEGIKYPNSIQRSMFLLLENIVLSLMSGSLELKLPDDDSDVDILKNFIKDKMISSGVTYYGYNYTISNDDVDFFLKRREIKLFLLEYLTIRYMNKNLSHLKNDDRKFFIARNKNTGDSKLIIGRDETDCISNLSVSMNIESSDLAIVEIDYDTWAILGGK
jgi:hypothetical protein